MWFAASFTFALFSLPGVIYMLYQLLGTAAMIGFAILLLSNSCSTAMYAYIKPVVRRLQDRRDERGQVCWHMLTYVDVC